MTRANLIVGSAVFAVLLAIVFIAVGLAAASFTSSEAPVVRATPATTRPPTPHSHITPMVLTPAPASPGVIFQAAGLGVSAPLLFAAPASWTLYYQFDCGAQGGQLVIYLYRGTQSLGDVVTTSGLTGGAQVLVPTWGVGLILKINTECAWSLRGEVP